MTRLGCSWAALLVSIVLTCLPAAWCQPLNVPSGAMPVGQGAVAKYQDLYPNAGVIGRDLCEFQPIGEANAVAIHSIQVPTKTSNVILEYPYTTSPLQNVYTTGVIHDYVTGEWRLVNTDDSIFCSGHSILADGRIVVAGGFPEKIATIRGQPPKTYVDGLRGLRILDAISGSDLVNVAQMALPRWYPTVTTLPDGRALVFGGVQQGTNNGAGAQLIEILEPTDNSISSFNLDDTYYREALFSKPFYPFALVLPTGHIYMHGDKFSCILNAYTGQCLKNSDGSYVSGPERPGGVSSIYPFTSSPVFGDLKPDANGEVHQVDVMLFGGSYMSDHPNFNPNGRAWGGQVYNPDAVACRLSHRMTISWKRDGPDAPWQYSFSDWTEEDIGYPRVMPDATQLPNGDIVIMNGAQTGVAGYARRIRGTNNSEALANYPAFWATLYQPDREVGQRYTLLCGSQQPRVYHGTASLTPDGTILVGGADRNEDMKDAEVPWFRGTKGVRPAFNLEIFKPPYVYDTANKPAIVGINGGSPDDNTTAMGYDTPFKLNFAPAQGAGPVNVTSVALIAPSSTTHSYNMHQRRILLNYRTTGAGELTVTTPKHPFVAIPGHYLIFINNVKTYSEGKWIKLVDTNNLGKQQPRP